MRAWKLHWLQFLDALLFLLSTFTLSVFGGLSQVFERGRGRANGSVVHVGDWGVFVWHQRTLSLTLILFCMCVYSLAFDSFTGWHDQFQCLKLWWKLLILPQYPEHLQVRYLNNHFQEWMILVLFGQIERLLAKLEMSAVGRFVQTNHVCYCYFFPDYQNNFRWKLLAYCSLAVWSNVR